MAYANKLTGIIYSTSTDVRRRDSREGRGGKHAAMLLYSGRSGIHRCDIAYLLCGGVANEVLFINESR